MFNLTFSMQWMHLQTYFTFYLLYDRRHCNYYFLIERWTRKNTKCFSVVYNVNLQHILFSGFPALRDLTTSTTRPTIFDLPSTYTSTARYQSTLQADARPITSLETRTFEQSYVSPLARSTPAYRSARDPLPSSSSSKAQLPLQADARPITPLGTRTFEPSYVSPLARAGPAYRSLREPLPSSSSSPASSRSYSLQNSASKLPLFPLF